MLYNIIKNKGDNIMPILLILGVFVIFALGWLLTCGIIKLICLCFGLTFSWLTATGIWLIMILLRSVFGGRSNN